MAFKDLPSALMNGFQKGSDILVDKRYETKLIICLHPFLKFHN